MKEMRANRRQVLAGAGLTLAGGALPPVASADETGIPMAGDGAALLVLQDQRLPLPDDVQRRLQVQGARVLALDADPVRMWRGAQADLLKARQTRLLGVTTWPQFLIVRGLAEESGRRVRYQRLDQASGAIVWLIA